VAGGIAITGLGAVSALGPDVPALRAGLITGQDGIGRLRLFEYHGRAGVAAEAACVPQGPWGLPPATLRRLSRPDRFALAAAEEAVRAAGLDARVRGEAALIAGATTGGMFETEEAYRRWRSGDTPRLAVSRVLGTSLASSGVAVAQAFGIHGPQETLSTACSSSALALARAAELIERGIVATAVAVGTDGLCRLTYAGFDALQALDPERCRPFDRERRGLTLGEGAAALVLENAAQANARGARPLAWLLGWGTSTDAHHPTAPHPEGRGAVAALRAALAKAALVPDAVDYVNAHGTGTPQNDVVEMGVLRAVLGTRLGRIPVSSSKSQFGHTLGAAGALEAVVTVLALAESILPPTLGLRAPDPAWADVDLVTEPGRRAALAVALSSSYGFGGHNVTLVLGRGGAA
jgi:3-oxoacyl-[acyl-carrier-protein] synthase II